MKELSTQNYEHVAPLIDAAIAEGVKKAREGLLKGHWLAGEIIREHCGNDQQVTGLVQYTAQHFNLSESTLWRCVEFYDKVPDFEDVYDLGEGENISWNKVRYYLKHGELPSKMSDKETKCTHSCQWHQKIA